jgi:hypothetical protein
MNFIGISLIVLSLVILIVSLVYIITINRTKERLAMMENNIDPTEHSYHQNFFNSLKIAFLFMGGGLGFIIALLVDEYLLTGIDNPAIYAGGVLFFSGGGLMLFHKFFKKD